MAEKRMVTKKVTDSDEFVSLPASAQALYLHLMMAADDDGFCNQIQLSMMKAHASVDDVKMLLIKRFILRFESGVIVIKHWRLHNTIRKDRYTQTTYVEELAQLQLKDNGVYTDMVAKRLPDGCQMVATDKNSIDKNRIDKNSNRSRFKPPTVEEVRAYCKERGNTVDADRFIDYYTANGWTQGKGKPVKDWKACVRLWERNKFESPKHETVQKVEAPAWLRTKKPDFSKLSGWDDEDDNEEI